MYIESEKVKFYPSAYRQYQDGGETKNINPESELNTEYNITSHIAKLLKRNKGSFIVDYVENSNLEFYLGGYYIHITSPQDILGAFSNATQIWANMKVVPFTPTDPTEGFSELYEVVDYEDNGKNIDELSGATKSFKGVAFLGTKDNTATFSLQLFTRQDTTKPWSILESSKFAISTLDIENGTSGVPMNTELDLATLNVSDTVQATSVTTNSLTVNNSATLDGTLTVGASTTFNDGATFNDNVNFTAPMTISNDVTQTGDLSITGDITCTNIEVTSGNITTNGKTYTLPNATSTLAKQSDVTSLQTSVTNLSNNKADLSNTTQEITAKKFSTQNVTISNSGITTSDLTVNSTSTFNSTMYTQNLYVTGLQKNGTATVSIGADSSSIDYGYFGRLSATNLVVDDTSTFNKDVTISGDLTVTGETTLGNAYVDKIYCDNFEPSGDNSSIGSQDNCYKMINAEDIYADTLSCHRVVVDTLTGIFSNIELSKSILPTQSTITLGNSSNKFSNIYANTFTGNLSGNVTGNLNGNANTATTATKLGSSAGSSINPVYFSNGVPVASSWNSSMHTPLSAMLNLNNVRVENNASGSANISSTFSGIIPDLDNFIVFATIDFSGDKVTLPFYRKNGSDYSSAIYLYGYYWVLKYQVVYISATTYTLNISLYYRDGSTYHLASERIYTTTIFFLGDGNYLD